MISNDLYFFQITPTAKKLWGVEEGKTDNKGIFTIGEQTWRDTAWSTGHTTGKLSYGTRFFKEFDKELRIEKL